MPKSQILSVYKTRDSNPQKVLDYKAALAAGGCSLSGDLQQNILDRLKALGIDMPETV
jgi:hypothetical protein